MIKKKTYNHPMLVRAVTLMTAVLLMSSSLTARAEEMSSSQSISYVYHKHIGSSNAEGGCYQTPGYHVHEGSEQQYGSCYEIPVYHSHSGDEISGGSCYGTVVLHEHQGNANEGGGCYQAVYHTHEASCYREIESSERGCYVIKVVPTDVDDYEGHDYNDYYMSCGEVVHGTNPNHSHVSLNCNQGNVVTGYRLGCGKSEESTDRYLFDCTKTDEDIDAYSLSCIKTTSDIDYYSQSCGRDIDTPVGKITLESQIDDSRKKETVTVLFEDLTQGDIQLSEVPFTWYDSAGHVLGTGDTMDFSDNGSYSVVLGVLNKDINENSLKADVVVSRIVKPVPGNRKDQDDEKEQEQEQEQEQFSATPIPTATPTPTPTPNVKPSAIPKASSSDAGSSSRSRQNTVKQNMVDETPTTPPVLIKQSQTVKPEERESEGEEVVEIQIVEQEEQAQSFFASPAGKLITITAGSLLAITGLFVVLYWLRFSVAVYNDDGRGNMIYLGRTKVKAQEEGYLIEITDAMAEKALTNRYCIKPGLFALFRGEEEELLVQKGQKRISVSLSEEMIVVI